VDLYEKASGRWTTSHPGWLEKMGANQLRWAGKEKNLKLAAIGAKPPISPLKISENSEMKSTIFCYGRFENVC